ncbi:MAG TPA: nuclease [Blastocatellia bacterium]|nr:nuclease [Blastocatellia bacterium]HMV86298.1 nuclease [Blastocatellia bacterium]HMX30379.1 nuclease [Blastocatellia bacterium]HMY73906.1 nuclease [Blastocatellia bacterium]HMZ19339.1 nuclease [Blastocatellia bacterium]
MVTTILLDTGLLGLLTNPNLPQATVACVRWAQAHRANGVRLIVPEIADYELRRELLRANKKRGIASLNNLIAQTEYLPITTSAMRLAAIFWAQARQQGQPTASDNNIDGDVILAAQAAAIGISDFVIATTNVKHLSRFVPAELWENIK